MDPKKLGVLGAVLAALSAAAWLASSRADRVERRRPLQAVNEGEVSKLLLDRADERIALEKSGGAWRLTSPIADAADAGAAADIIAGLASLSLGSQVSQEPASYPSYSLNESSATRLRLVAGGAAPVFDAYFGKEALGYDSLYVRLAGEKPVYLASGLGAYRINRSVNDLRERSVLGLEKSILQTVKISAGRKSFELSKSSSGWTASGLDLKPEELESLVSKLAALKAADFAAAGEKAAGLDKPVLRVEAAGTLKKAGVSVGAMKSGYRYAKVDGREAVLLVSAGDVDEMLKSLGAGGKR